MWKPRGAMGRLADMHQWDREQAQWKSVRTDLAVEVHEDVSRTLSHIPGLSIDIDEQEQIKTTRMQIETQEASEAMQKLMGTYVTLEVPELRHKDPDLQELVALRLADEVKQYIRVPEQAVILVIGLGNWNVTPDALGPLVVENLFVTRHLFHLMPDILDEGFRSVCAVAPGVLGITGIETTEIVQGVVDRVKPDLVIAIDALAARSLDRVNTTIQLANSGIQPGAGVGNNRRALNKETLGVDVIAIGVPTVLDAATIASDAMDIMLTHLEQQVPGNAAVTFLNQFDHEQKRQLISELLQPIGNNLMVTPKEIDEFVEDIAHVVAMGLNLAMHPAMTIDDARTLTH